MSSCVHPLWWNACYRIQPIPCCSTSESSCHRGSLVGHPNSRSFQFWHQTDKVAPSSSRRGVEEAKCIISGVNLRSSSREKLSAVAANCESEKVRDHLQWDGFNIKKNVRSKRGVVPWESRRVFIVCGFFKKALLTLPAPSFWLENHSIGTQTANSVFGFFFNYSWMRNTEMDGCHNHYRLYIAL